MHLGVAANIVTLFQKTDTPTINFSRNSTEVGVIREASTFTVALAFAPLNGRFLH
jgi:hypothetical protein